MALNAASVLDGALEAGQQAVRTLAALPTDDDRIEIARTFGVRAVTEWWVQLEAPGPNAQSVRPFLRPFATVKLPAPLAAMAHELAAIVAGMEPESAAHVIGQIYTKMLPVAFRSKFGVFYTPPALAERLIDLATAAGVDWTHARVLDPACGGGAFLAPVAQRIIKSLPKCSPRILLRNISMRLRGYEIDPFAAWLSQVTLDAVLLPISRLAGERLQAVVTICNSLEQFPTMAEFDLVIGNPPYGRISLPESDRKRFGRGLYGHANLYGLFTDIALRHAKRGAVVAYVTPTSFLAGQYFKNLRVLLARDAPPVAIDLVEARKGVFDGVLQETLLATYSVGGAVQSIELHTIKVEARSQLVVSKAGATELPFDPAEPWLLPRSSADVALVCRLAAMPHRLADWGYEVSTGPLVWNRHKDQLVRQAGPRRFPLIWAEAISPDGQFIYRANKRNHAPFFEFRHGDEWLLTKRPCVLLQRTTAKEQSRRLIAACLPEAFLNKAGGTVVIENHVNMVRAKTGSTPSVSGPTLAAFLNSIAADRAFRCVSGSVAVSAFELEALPLPPPSELRKLETLVNSGASKTRIEAECVRLYADKDESASSICSPKARRRSTALSFS